MTKPHVAVSSIAWAAFLYSSSAGAAFPQATCSSAGHSTVVPVSIGALEYNRKPQGIPATFNNYQHNTRSPSRWIVLNSNVESLRRRPSIGEAVTDIVVSRSCSSSRRGRGSASS